MISFAHPERLWLLVTLAPFFALRLRAARLRRRDWGKLRRSGTPPGAAGTSALILASSLVFLALARPRWGTDGGAELPPGKDVVIAVDVSRSMAARDAVPDRIGVAIESAVGLVSALAERPGNRVAVVAFAGAPVLRCGLTENLGAAIDALRRLRPGTARPGGTEIASAVDLCVDSFDAYDRAGGRVVVLLTDGEDHSGAWRGALERWRGSGVVIHAVTIGDSERGAPIPTGADGEFVESEGRRVESKRDDAPLEAIAQATGGVFVPLGTSAADMKALYVSSIAPREDRVRHEVAATPARERYGLFLLAALGAALIPFERLRLASTPLLLFAIAAVGAAPAEDARSLVDGGRAAFAAGRFADALALFERARELRPEDAVVRYNVAATLARLGKIREAEAEYRSAAQRADPTLRLKIDYCLANGLLTVGKTAEAIEGYDRFIARAGDVAELTPLVQDAKINREFARGLDKSSNERPSSPESGDGGKREAGREPNHIEPPERREPSDRSGPPGSGGAGGQGRDGVRPGTPEDRLRRAVEEIRAAKRGSPEPPDSADESAAKGKDW